MIFSMCGFSVFAYSGELVEGCPTSTGTMYNDTEHGSKIALKEASDSYADVPYTVDQDAKSLTYTHTAVKTSRNNFNPKGSIDLSAITWKKTGTIVLTYEVTLTSPSDNEFRVGIVPRVTTSDGKTIQATENGTVDKLINQCSFAKGTAAGTTIYAKTVWRFTSTALYADLYAKTTADGEYAYKNTLTNTNKFQLTNSFFTTLEPYGATWGTETGNNVAQFTISNINITETYGEAQLEDISGNYLALEGEPAKDVNYYIPDGFSTAELKLGTETLASFSADDGDVCGSYKTTIDFSKFEVADNVPLTLTVKFPDDDSATQTKTVKVNINAPITEASMTDVSGRYPHTDTVTVNYEIPHVYDSATLTFNGEKIAEYSSDKDAGGKFSTDIVLSDYANLGDDVPVTLTVKVGDDKTVITYKIDVYYYYASAELEDVSGYYTTDDTLKFAYTLPTDYTTASLALGEKTIKSFTAGTDIGGEYTQVYELKTIDFKGKTSAELDLTFTVDGTELTDTITVYNVVASISHMTEDFEGTTIKPNALGAGGIDTTTFDSRVYRYNFTDDTQNLRFEMRCISNASVNEDWFLDVTCDFYVADPHMQVGLSLVDKSGSQYKETPKFWIADGKVMENENCTYEAGKWYTLKQRIIPRQYTADGKGKICLYIDGKYAGCDNTEADLGYKMIGLYYRNGGCSKGYLYIDNVSVTGYAPCYNVGTAAVDASGKEIGAVDYENPRIALKFDQKVNSKTVSTEAIKLTSFNGTEIPSAVSYDSDANIIYITPSEALFAGSEYKVTLANTLKSVVGGGYEGATELSFTTANQPVYVKSANAPKLSEIGANSSFNVTVTLEKDSSTDASGYIYAAYYCGNQLQSVSSTPVSGSGLTYTMPLKSRENTSGERRVEIYYMNGRNDFSVIDTFEIK